MPYQVARVWPWEVVYGSSRTFKVHEGLILWVLPMEIYVHYHVLKKNKKKKNI